MTGQYRLPMFRQTLPTLLLITATAFAQKPCASLRDLQLTGATITSSVIEPEAAASGRVVPEHCRVQGVARPTSDSEIHFELWLPVADKWNGKYQQKGSGGWAGSITTPALAEALTRGYAAAATDDGHVANGGSAAWAIGHPEKLIDFAYRAVHQTRIQAVAIINAFYGKAPKESYFYGCSDGGREALMEAQRYPEDFDGIVAGAPANNWSHMMAGMIWNEQALLGKDGSAIPAAKLPAIQKAALNACDAVDGVKDGLIEDPRACHFNPDVLQCKSGTDTPDCLTAPQLSALKKLYAGLKDPNTGKQIFPGFPPGTENRPGGWGLWITPAKPDAAVQFVFGNTYFGQAVHEQPNWDFHSFTLTDDLALADRKAGWILDSTNPDLRSFRDHHGKLIQFHGWGDAAISPYNSIAYYESVRDFLTKYPDPRTDTTKSVSDFYRLFMVPGLGHCGSGAGTTDFGGPMQSSAPSDPRRDVLSALDRWVEEGTAPDSIIAQGTVPDDATKKLTRPLCPYPQVAHYKGAGDPFDTASFECAVPPAK